MGQEVRPEAVTAALKSLRGDGYDLGGSARVADYIWEGQTSEEREAGLRRLKDADKLAEQVVRNAISDALRAASNA